MPVLKPESRYSNRLNQILNFTHQNSHKNLKLDSLAGIACLSKYHFSRVFHDELGESPIRFLKRIRLERAACLLKNRHVPISRIAMNCGYNSSQSFSREFANKFETGPRQYRVNYLNKTEESSGNSYLNSAFSQFQSIGIEYDLQASAEKIKIVKMTPTKVAYIRSIGRYGGCNNIYKAMQSIRNWGLETGYWHDETELIGTSWDYSSMTPENLCRYDACIPVPDHACCNDGVSVRMIPGGLYARAKIPYRCVTDFPLIWHWFSLTLRTSVKFSNYTAKLYTGPWYEKYKFKSSSGRSFLELYAQLYGRHCGVDHIEKL